MILQTFGAVLFFIQSASRSPPGQVWDQFFCHFGSLFESIVTPWEALRCSFQVPKLTLAPKVHHDPPPQKLTHPFGPILGPQKSQKSDQNHFLRGSRNGSKNRITFREPKSEILLLFTTLEQGQTCRKWTPFWELFGDQFSTKYEKMSKRRIPKNRYRKKVTLRKFGCLSEDPEAP